jgi:hypothetical protein
VSNAASNCWPAPVDDSPDQHDCMRQIRLADPLEQRQLVVTCGRTLSPPVLMPAAAAPTPSTVLSSFSFFRKHGAAVVPFQMRELLVEWLEDQERLRAAFLNASDPTGQIGISAAIRAKVSLIQHAEPPAPTPRPVEYFPG